MKRLYKLVLLITVLVIILNTGCSKNNNENKIAYISSNPNSKYENTFNELHLGILFDFNLKLPNADKTWITLWVEGYTNGKLFEPFLITELSYGLSPKKVEEGPIGLGIIKPSDEKMELFLYSSGANTIPRIVDNNFLIDSGISSWGYTIGSNPIA